MTMCQPCCNCGNTENTEATTLIFQQDSQDVDILDRDIYCVSCSDQIVNELQRIVSLYNK